jgi:hypothetical protein
VGEIAALRPSVHLGYHANPAANAEAFTDDGWFRTGDLGQILDSAGNVATVGGRKEIINRGGEKFFRKRCIDVGIRAEQERDGQRVGPVIRRRRLHIAHPGHAIDGVLQWLRDALLDGVGVGARIGRTDFDRRRRDLWIAWVAIRPANVTTIETIIARRWRRMKTSKIMVPRRPYYLAVVSALTSVASTVIPGRTFCSQLTMTRSPSARPLLTTISGPRCSPISIRRVPPCLANALQSFQNANPAIAIADIQNAAVILFAGPQSTGEPHLLEAVVVVD